MHKELREIRVLTYNIHKGLGRFKRKYVLDSLKDSLSKLSLDIVFLQEVIGEHSGHQKKFPDWSELSQYEFLADELWQDYAYAQNATYSEGHHGNAILTKFPIKNWDQTNISTNKFEQRGILHCQIEVPFENTNSINVHLYCVHLDLFSRGRKIQFNKIKAKMNEHIKEGDFSILAGDFNDWKSEAKYLFESELGMKEAHKEINGAYGRTFPSILPLLKLDRIYFKGPQILNCEILMEKEWKKLSDHKPILATFQIEETSE